MKAHQAAFDLAKRRDVFGSDPEWLNLLGRALALGPFIANEIDNAKAELRDPNAFFDPKPRTKTMLQAVFA
ncbi:hypothetical protein NLM16_07460 [Bradyrhizobium brasilense]|uniref:hypothetical protein n=1 Tax=Bradyrhizobium brasilense TaxID=1419277 RepID=UPI002877974B|nr:hypothetical protein [Bradyrhizobium brasilense]MCP3413931.1 hypothetical protein [Bradyrhizobium brasilense]